MNRPVSLDVRAARREALAALVRRPALAAAALANQSVRAWLAAGLLDEGAVRANPPVRVEFVECHVFAGAGDALSAATGKRFGAYVGLFPLTEDDPVDYWRVLYRYTAANPYNRRVEGRKALKRALGRGFSRLVGLAAHNPLKRFLPALTAADVDAIARRVGTDPRGFWRMATGAAAVRLPEPPRQLELFGGE